MPGPIEASAMRQALIQQMEPQDPNASPMKAESGIGIAPYAAMLGGQGSDLGTTLAALSRGGFRETNPLGGPGVIAAKAAMMPILAILMKKLAASGHPTAAKVMGYGAGAAGAVPAAINASRMAK